MTMTVATRNSLLDGIDALATHASLHTAWSTTGANEVSGGSPAYARQAIAWSAASAAVKSWAGSETFDVPAGSTICFVGLFSASTSGTFRGMFPLGSTGYKEIQVDVSTDVISSEGHGFSDTNQIVFLNGTAPGGLTEGTIYFVRDATTDTFKVAATSGGTAINLTSDGDAAVVVSRIVPETFGAQGTYTVNDLDYSLP
jgi:hypothetical protein